MWSVEDERILHPPIRCFFALGLAKLWRKESGVAITPVNHASNRPAVEDGRGRMQTHMRYF